MLAHVMLTAAGSSGLRKALVPTGQPIRNGFGMELLTRLLPYDLDATTSVDFQESELRFQLELPAEHVMNTAGK